MVRLQLSKDESVKITAFPQTITISTPQNDNLRARYKIINTYGDVLVFELDPNQTIEYRVKVGPCTIKNVSPSLPSNRVIIVEYSL
ncbi:hypothetical protein [Clostridium felsineum]|uniref:Uncharacterized protein n=1 Tax=Clostridium felsineum TaxID=36839 RepID=A0A1S8MF32_9CLOT|nr:hypothetical protein [Clostridium felsineum]MCR3758618.1 hypothetical protein [Clostridium felsineum]URZ04551.1 hypothetical protein CLAUR_046400 [Clostridium felsineum]URZ09210.1 hypothetical protein CLROS_046260 [Clostridium felsineum]URZ13896.1 hypothetical protein CROST_046740 [Clostridium felsineum]